MNKWMGIGRLTAEPTITMTQGRTKVAKYRLAVDRAKKQDGTQETDYISCVCFNKSADFVERYLNKGVKIAVIGRIQTGSYEKDGQKIYTTDIVVEEHEFCESKKATAQATQPTQTAPSGFETVEEDGFDLPF